jgi:formylglycine-generating enzyme required for sulfatase activity
MDRTPVTNRAYLRFVVAHPEWRRDRVATVLAEAGYLARWASADALAADAGPEEPVVGVSWFAARAYCAARGARLPTEAEWEHAAAASRSAPDGATDPAWRAEVLALYSRPSLARLPSVGAGAANFWGLHDMHGVVWEWVSDFGNATSAFASGPDRLRFCGATAAGASDATDFGAFERVALRTSLHANYTLRSLGFRCAAQAEGASR